MHDLVIRNGLVVDGTGADPRPNHSVAIDGEVIFIGAVADAQTGNVPAHIAVDNLDNRLVIGETLYAEITLDQPESTLAVPLAAVHDEGEGSVITVVRDGKAVYDRTCVACHASGVANAPKLGDKAAWAPRIATGKAALMASVVNGKGAMPPKAGAAGLKDEDIGAAIDYMLASVK